MTARTVVWALAALGLIGCGVKPLPLDHVALVEAPAGAAEGIARVCSDYGVNECPRVYFFGPESINCTRPGQVGWEYDGGCIMGLTGSDGILIGLWSLDEKPSQFAVAHELAHWRWDDPEHSSLNIWGANGAHDDHVAGSIVGDENATLAAAGM